MKIYIIEDDAILREELIKILAVYGYSCDYTDDFENVIMLVQSAKLDLILLDINLPYYDGYHICREIRKKSEVPIIIVTSRNTDMDELMGINLGADDFVTKPYNKQILLARIAAVLKRTENKTHMEALEHKGLILSLAKSTVTFENKTEELTKNELHILSAFIKNAGRISNSCNNGEFSQEIELKSISASQISRRLRATNPEIIQELFKRVIAQAGAKFGFRNLEQETGKFYIIDSVHPSHQGVQKGRVGQVVCPTWSFSYAWDDEPVPLSLDEVFRS